MWVKPAPLIERSVLNATGSFSATFISQNEIWATAPMRTRLPLRRRDDQKVFLGFVPLADSLRHTHFIIQTGEISFRFDPASNNRFRFEAWFEHCRWCVTGWDGPGARISPEKASCTGLRGHSEPLLRCLRQEKKITAAEAQTQQNVPGLRLKPADASVLSVWPNAAVVIKEKQRLLLESWWTWRSWCNRLIYSASQTKW